MSMNATVLITGANGRIGSLLMCGLADLGWSTQGCDVAAGTNVVAADITDLAALSLAARGCRSIIHLAATPNAKPGWETVNRLNIHGTRTVLEAARREGVAQVIFASSIHTVGALPAHTSLGPDLPPAPSGIYGASKLAGEALMQVYALKGQLSCISVRLCSFRPAPEDARELKTWLGHQDAIHLFDRCLHEPALGYQMIWGVSNNTRLSIYDPIADLIGYRPSQDAEGFLPSLAHQDRLNATSRPWTMLGGPVAEDPDVDFGD